MTKRSLVPVARLGYAARGTVYVLVGGLALMAAMGMGGRTTDTKGALSSLSDNSWGTAAIVIIGLGLIAFAGWRAVQAFLDADDHGRDPRGMIVRLALAISAITHLLLGIYALTLASALNASSGGSGSKDAAALMLQQPYGRYVLGAVALAIAGGAVAQIWKGAAGGFRKRLAMRANLLDWLAPVCGFGLVTRGLIFLLIAGFFLYAAVILDPDQAGGLESALHWLRGQPYGTVFFASTATGLFAFGLYSWIEAIWRRVA